MHPEELRRLHHAVPFEPFSLALADGRSFYVPHPDFISIAPKGSAVALWAEDGHIGGYLGAVLTAEVHTGRVKTPRGAKRRRSGGNQA